MNLIEAQRNLQGIPDDALIKEMRQPTGIAPQYLVLSELQRRKALRAESGAQAPTTTVRQDVVGFAEGGAVENKPGWMEGGLGDFLNSGLLGFGLPFLNDIADGTGEGLFGIGLQPWILKQLGFGNKGEQPPVAPVQAQNPLMRGFAGGGDVKKDDFYSRLIKRESDPNVKDPFLSSNKHTNAIGGFQIMPETWNDTIRRFKIPGVKPVSKNVRPGDKDFPSESQQRLVYQHIEKDYDRVLEKRGYELSEPNKYLVHWQGPGAGPKLLDYYAANPDATAEEAFKYARPDAYRVVMKQNHINPKAMLADVMGKVERDFGSYAVGTRLNDDGIRVPSREEFAANLQQTMAAPEDPDYLALLEEERMSSVPAQSAWNGQAQEQQLMAPGQAMIGPRITGGGIDQLMPQLTSPTRRPGEGPAPWQVIAGPQSFAGRFKAKGYAGGGPVKVKDGIEYRENDTGNYVDAQGRPYPEDWNALTGGLETMAYGIDTTRDVVGGALGGIGNAASWAMQPTGQRAPVFGRPAAPPPPPTPSMPVPNIDQAALLKGFQGMMSTPETMEAEAATKADAGAATGNDFDTMEQYLSARKKLNEPTYDDPSLGRTPRDTERDKWLAIAEFGSRLASGSSPHFAQNFGPAAAAGIASYRQSQAQYDDDMMKRTNARLQQTQLNELARSRTDNTAAKLTEISGNVQEARIRAQAQLSRMSAALKYGQSIDPQTYASRLRDYKDLIMADPVLTYEQKMIEMKKAEAMVFNDLNSKGIFKSQRGLGSSQAEEGAALDFNASD